MQKLIVIVLLICALPNRGRAQITAVGITTGFKSDFSNALQAGSFAVGFMLTNW